MNQTNKKAIKIKKSFEQYVPGIKNKYVYELINNQIHNTGNIKMSKEIQRVFTKSLLIIIKSMQFKEDTKHISYDFTALNLEKQPSELLQKLHKEHCMHKSMELKNQINKFT